MPLFIIETTAESPIREFWQVEAANAREARDKFDNGEVGAFLWDEVTWDETEREVSLVHGPEDLASTVAIHRAQQAAPAMLAALQELVAWHDNPNAPDPGVWLGEVLACHVRPAIAAATGAPTDETGADDSAVLAAANLSRAGLIDAAGEALALAIPTGETETACASCGAPEGESHGARCEARGFANGVAAATGER